MNNYIGYFATSLAGHDKGLTYVITGVDNEYVYVTDYGVRYHWNENCSEINRTIIEISRNKVTGMRACRLCAAGDN